MWNLFVISEKKMEDWQRQHITQNLPELITVTEFNVVVKAKLVASNVLSQPDVEELVILFLPILAIYYKTQL